MEMTNKNIDHGKAFDWGRKLLKNMEQSTVIFIPKDFMQN